MFSMFGFLIVFFYGFWKRDVDDKMYIWFVNFYVKGYCGNNDVNFIILLFLLNFWFVV